MSDLRLTLASEVGTANPVAHDLYIDGSDFVLFGGAAVDGADYSAEVAQGIVCALRLIRGEWYLDQRIGTPWHERILGKAGVVAGESTVEGIFRRVVLTVPGVAAVERCEVTIHRATSHLSVELDATTDLSTTITIARLDLPMIVRMG